MNVHPLKDWLLMLSLVVMWGSAFLFNSIALQSLSPSLLVTVRLIIGALVLALVALWKGLDWSSLNRRLLGWFLAMAVIGNTLPFYLIAWGQQYVSSSLAGILMAVMPIATLVMAHFLIHGESLTRRKGLGFLLGFLGIVILMGADALKELAASPRSLVAQFAILGGALCYAAGSIIARLRPESDDLLTSTVVLAQAALITLPFSLPDMRQAATGASLAGELSVTAIGAILFLGIIATGLATVVYFILMRRAGPTFLSLINYLIPLWALLAGVIVLNETVTPQAIIALTVILAGIALSQARRRFW